MQTNYKWIQYFQRPVPNYFTLRTGGVLSLLLVSGDQREKAGERERKSYRGRESGRKTIPTTCSLLKRLHSPELNPCIPCSWRGSKYSMTTSGPQSAYYTKKLEQGTKPGLQFRQSNTDGASTAQSNDCSLKS